MLVLLEFFELFLALFLAGFAVGIACEGLYEFDFFKIIIPLAIGFCIIWFHLLFFGFVNEFNGLSRMAVMVPIIIGLLVALSPLDRWRAN